MVRNGSFDARKNAAPEGGLEVGNEQFIHAFCRSFNESKKTSKTSSKTSSKSTANGERKNEHEPPRLPDTGNSGLQQPQPNHQTNHSQLTDLTV